MRHARTTRARGFTLVEVAIVLLVLGVLARAAIAPLGERLEERRREATDRRLEDVRRALIGHLVTRGALPCPLPLDGSGRGEARAIGPGTGSTATTGRPDGRCTRGRGRVPAAVLGLAGPIDADGALLDGWGQPLQYAVSLVSGEGGASAAPYWITPGELPRVGLRRLDADLVLCRAVGTDDCPRAARRAEAIAFVVLSTGEVAEPRPLERENLDGDRVYVLAPPSTVPGHRFDDHLAWASRDELAYRLLQAGWLP